MKELFKDLKGMKILDVGCGNGEILGHLRTIGGQVYGIEYTNSAVKATSKRMIPICKADARNIPFLSNTFDIVCSFGVIEHFKETEIALKEIYRVCKQRGTAVITVPNLCCLFPILAWFWCLFRRKLRYYRAASGKSYTKGKLLKIMHETGFVEIKITPFKLVSLLQWLPIKYSERLAKIVEESFLNSIFGIMLFAVGKKK